MQDFGLKPPIKKISLKEQHLFLSPFKFTQNEWMHQRDLFKRKLFGVLLILLCSLLYLFVNKYNNFRFADTKPIILIFKIDNLIPFSKYSVIPYYFYYLYISGTLLALYFRKDSSLFFRHVFSVTLSSIIALLIFIIFPTYVPRPNLMETDFLTRMMKHIYSIDPPYNCFPSMHVFYSLICFWHLSLLNRKSFKFMTFNILSFVLISISTVFTKQHYTPDILGGLVLGVFICWISTLLYNRRLKRKI